MPCNQCTKAKSLMTCSDLVNLGTVDIATEYYIYIKNLGTGRTHRQTQSSDGGGGLQLDLTDPDVNFYQPGNTYELWITETPHPGGSENLNERTAIKVVGSEGSATKIDQCYHLTFEKVHEEENVATEAEQTMTA